MVKGKDVLVWGILGLAFALATGFLGVIFSAIGMKKANQYVAEGNELCGQAKVGAKLAKAGLVVGIILTVLYVIYIAVVAAAVAQL